MRGGDDALERAALARAMEAAKIGAERAVLGSRFPSSPLPDKRGPGKL